MSLWLQRICCSGRAQQAMGESFQNPCDDQDRRKRVKCCSKRGAKCQRGSRCRTCRCRRNRIYSDDSERCIRRLPTTPVYFTTSGESTRFESSTPKSRPVPIQTSQSSYVTSGTNSTRSYWSSKSNSPPVETTAFSYVSRGSQDPASGNFTERPAQTTPRSSPSKRNKKPRPPKHKSKLYANNWLLFVKIPVCKLSHISREIPQMSWRGTWTKHEYTPV